MTEIRIKYMLLKLKLILSTIYYMTILNSHKKKSADQGQGFYCSNVVNYS